jgi:hypothetical protein
MKYLRAGRVVRSVHKENGGLHVEHFWLCGDCYQHFDFRFLPSGAVEIAPRTLRITHQLPMELPMK